MFHMYDKKIISVTSHALDRLSLSQTVTPSPTPPPSSVTYFMDGPLVRLPTICNQRTCMPYNGQFSAIGCKTNLQHKLHLSASNLK